MKQDIVTIKLPREIISTVVAYSAFGDKCDWDVFVEACKQALNNKELLMSEMMSEINNLNNALIDTYAVLSGGNTGDVFRKVSDKEDFKVLTVAKVKEVIRTVTGGRVKKGK